MICSADDAPPQVIAAQLHPCLADGAATQTFTLSNYDSQGFPTHFPVRVDAEDEPFLGVMHPLGEEAQADDLDDEEGVYDMEKKNGGGAPHRPHVLRAKRSDRAA